MNDATDDRDLDQADTQILTPELSDEALEAAAATSAAQYPRAPSTSSRRIAADARLRQGGSA